jgi:periplasmic protein TonB
MSRLFRNLSSLAVIFMISVCSLNVNAQEEKETNSKDIIFTVVEEEAEFIGGIDKLMEFLVKNLNYPQEAKEKGIEGKVIITFVVEKDGSIADLKLTNGIGYGCDEEAIRVVKLMPKWKPAKQRGKNVRQQFILPINFNLSQEEKN